MVNLARGDRPIYRQVASIAHIRAGNMRIGFARGILSIVAGDATAGNNASVVKVGTYPRGGGVAVLANIAGRQMVN